MAERITFNPKILGGKPIIKGTRISVDFVLELFATGITENEILKEYPKLTRADIRAALDCAARTMKREEVILTH
ncbi:MAG: DUF433 domain-containing protein [bacterium]|nr:DUF433 domain-containing protein [bacterium]